MLYELNRYEAMTLQDACVAAQCRAEENAESAERYANNQRLSEATRASTARVAKWCQERAAASARHSTRAGRSPRWSRQRRLLNDENFIDPADRAVAGGAALVHRAVCGSRPQAAHGNRGAPDAAAVGAFAVGGVTMQRYAIVIYDKRTGDVFTTLMQAEDGAAAVAAMNRKDWGTSLRPLSLILLPKPGSEK